jgi:hypothetical protein
VCTLLDYLEAGQRLDEFLEDFPTVGRDHAVGVVVLGRTERRRSTLAAGR